MSGTGASKLPEKTERKTVEIVGHEGEGNVKKVTSVGAEFAKGRTMDEAVGNQNMKITGKKGGSADEVTAVGLKFN